MSSGLHSLWQAWLQATRGAPGQAAHLATLLWASLAPDEQLCALVGVSLLLVALVASMFEARQEG